MFAVAIDRSYRQGIEVLAVVASSLTRQEDVVRYADFFKHMRKLGRYRRIYIPKMLKLVEQLIKGNSIAGLRIFTSIGSLIDLVSSRLKTIEVCVVDNTIAGSYTSTGTRVEEQLREIPVVVLESQLRKPSKELIETLHKLNVELVFLRTLHTVSDNVANYARGKFEEQPQGIPQVWRL